MPIKEIANIHTGNALDTDWQIVVDIEKLTYIIGNPPFRGYTKQTKSQKEDMKRVFNGKASLDYVAAWYQKAVEYIQDTNIRIGFVSTNSICQGEQVSILWKDLLTKFGMNINFAHQAFQWSNKAPNNPAVHVVIIGLWAENAKEKHLHTYTDITGESVSNIVKHINPYLFGFESKFLNRRTKPLSDVPIMSKGSQATDGGNLFLTKIQKDAFLESDPQLKKYVKQFMGSDECIKNKERYCLWLKDHVSIEINNSKFIQGRLEKVRIFREGSKKKTTQNLAETPYLFGEDRQPSSRYLLVPSHSSETRKYVPTGFFNSDVIVGNSAFFVPDADEYVFGVFSSIMHMTWMKYVCGRLESRYRYSNTIVYNNFPWPVKPSEKSVQKVTEAAKKLLEIRTGLQKNSTLYDIYSKNSTPKTLLDAHKKLDSAVDKCYRQKSFKNDDERMEFLFNLHVELVKEEEE